MSWDAVLEKMQELGVMPMANGGWLWPGGGEGGYQQRDIWRQEVEHSRCVLQGDVVGPSVGSAGGIAVSVSPCGGYCLRVKKSEKDESVWMQIWTTKGHLVTSIPSQGIHDQVYRNGDCFGGFSWDVEQCRLYYTAEEVRDGKKGTLYGKKKAEEEDVQLGDEYLFREIWGETLANCYAPRIYCVDWKNRSIERIVTGIEDTHDYGQPVWCSLTHTLYFIAHDVQIRKYGIVACTNRACQLMSLPLADGIEKASDTIAKVVSSVKDISLHSLRLSPNGKVILYVGYDHGSAHNNCAAIRKLNIEDGKVDTVIPVVELPEEGAFTGIYSFGLPQRVWVDDRHVVVPTLWRSRACSLRVDVEEGTFEVLRVPSPLPSDMQLSVVDCGRDGRILAIVSSLCVPPQLMVGVWKEGQYEWNVDHISLAYGASFSYELLTVSPVEDVEASPYPFEVYVLYPKGKEKRELPVVIYPHGGPHSNYPNAWSLPSSLLASCGAAVAIVNYRGSTGFGQKFVESLLGKAGKNDVSDCYEALQAVLRSGIGKKENVCVWGGSHGGFLTGHLVGQYPDAFRAAAMWNPVTDLASMAATTDIGDWLYAEGMPVGAPREYNGVLLDRLYRVSPIYHVNKVKAPVLMLLGAVDLRVPPHQGRRYAEALKENQVEVRVLSYPKSGHGIREPGPSVDAIANVVHWLFSKGFSL